MAYFLIFQVFKRGLESEPVGGGIFWGGGAGVEEQLMCIRYQTAPHDGT